MHRNTWKARERQVARYFGTERTALSGSASGGSSSDTKHEYLYVECKTRERFASVSLWHEANVKAKKEGKVPVVALMEKRRKGFWLMVHSDDLASVWLARSHALHQSVADEILSGKTKVLKDTDEIESVYGYTDFGLEIKS